MNFVNIVSGLLQVSENVPTPSEKAPLSRLRRRLLRGLFVEAADGTQ